MTPPPPVRLPLAEPERGPRPHACHIVPPYVLHALASSGDSDVEQHARTTLAHDEELRRRRAEPVLPAPLPGPATPSSPSGPTVTGEGLRRSVHDAKGARTLPGTLVREEGDPASGDEAVDQAYDGLGATWELLWTAYGRSSLDGKGLPLVASVHYGRDYDNAFWDGSQMVFGDGDGQVFLGFTRSLDVIGHELTHGVTQYTSGLAYRGQSGALNESVSDVFGVLVKQRHLGQDAASADWLVGSELFAPGVKGTALRSMKAPGTAYDDPRLGKDPQPDHMDRYVETTDDNGGVHVNSGIPNRAFYLVASALGGNAWEAAGQIWYDTVTGEIKADCDFATFAELTATAAERRFGAGSREAGAVREAWTTVGVIAARTGTAARPGSATDGGGATEAAGRPATDAPPDETDPGTRLHVERTGGFAGVILKRTLEVGTLPSEDREAWHRLLRERTLARLAADSGGRTHPDAFCYGVRCESPPVDVSIPEPALSDDVRGLFERTLASGA